MMMKIALSAIALLQIWVFAYAQKQNPEDVKPDFIIAVVVPKGEPALADLSQQVINGAILGLEAPQSGYWMGGAAVMRKNMLYFDDAGNPAIATKLAQEAVVKRKVLAVIGHYNSGTAIPASEVYEAAGIVHISTGASNPYLTGRGYQYVFRTTTDDAVMSEMFAKYIVDNTPTPNATFFVSDGTAYADAVLKGPWQLAEKNKAPNAAVLQNIPIIKDAKDFDGKTFFANRKVGGNNALHIGSFNILFARKIMDQLPLDANWVVYGGDVLCINENASYLKNKPFKLLCSTQGRYELGTPINPKFAVDYYKKFGTQPSAEAAHAYDATRMLLDAILRVGKPDNQLLMQALKQAPLFKGIAGDIQFDKNGNNTKRLGYVYEALDGELRLKAMIN